MQFNSAKNWIALYSNQVFFLKIYTFSFSFIVFSPGWKVFLLTIFYDLFVITWPSEWKSCDNYQSIASPHPVWLPSWRSVPPHLRHWIGGARFLLIYALRVDGTSTYRSEGYPVATDAYQVWYEIWDYDREQESDDEGLRRWWCMKSGRWSLAFIFDRSIRMGWFP